MPKVILELDNCCECKHSDCIKDSDTSKSLVCLKLNRVIFKGTCDWKCKPQCYSKIPDWCPIKID